jgi:hypothetical protein
VAVCLDNSLDDAIRGSGRGGRWSGVFWKDTGDRFLLFVERQLVEAVWLWHIRRGPKLECLDR